jgi:hypothetical protein
MLGSGGSIVTLMSVATVGPLLPTTSIMTTPCSSSVRTSAHTYG